MLILMIIFIIFGLICAASLQYTAHLLFKDINNSLDVCEQELESLNLRLSELENSFTDK